MKGCQFLRHEFVHGLGATDEEGAFGEVCVFLDRLCRNEALLAALQIAVGLAAISYGLIAASKITTKLVLIVIGIVVVFIRVWTG